MIVIVSVIGKTFATSILVEQGGGDHTTHDTTHDSRFSSDQIVIRLNIKSWDSYLRTASKARRQGLRQVVSLLCSRSRLEVRRP